MIYIDKIPNVIASIYSICNSMNNKKYIGMTRGYLQIRIKTHISYLERGDHYNRFLQSDWTTYKIQSFTLSILECNIPIDKIVDKEIEYINKYTDIYNISGIYNDLEEHNKRKLHRSISKANTKNGELPQNLVGILMTPKEVAEVMQTDIRTIIDLAKTNDIPGVLKVGGIYRFRRKEIEELVEEFQ